MSPNSYPNPKSRYEFVCLCGARVASHLPKTRCPKCGALLEVRGHGEMEEESTLP